MGKVNDNSTLVSIPYDGYKGVCTSVTSTHIRKYAGREVIGLRVAFGTYDIEDLHLFLSSDPDPSKPANDLASAEPTEVTDGWSDILFDTSYTLTGTETELYAGYFFSCTSTELRPVILGSNTSKYGLLVWTTGQYGAGWYDYSDSGNLAVQLILRGLNDGVREIGTQPANAITYDLSGRRVEKTAKPGLYVRGGKKVVVK